VRKPEKIAAYIRVSTGSQDTANQLLEIETWAERHRCEIVEIYKDHALSGAKRRDQRPSLDRMMKDARMRRFDAVVVWSLDRLGRSLSHLLELIEDLQHSCVGFICLKQNIDTTSATGRLLLGILGSLSEYERELVSERTRAGQQRARRAGVKFGRPRLSPSISRKIHSLRADGLSMARIARELGIGPASVHRELTTAQ
jgi:DNA invertase Pin-like site-specific DNA recombinase